MLLNSVWMIGKNSPALAPSSWITGVLALAEGGIAAAIARNPSVRGDPSRRSPLRKAPSSAPVAAGSTAIRALPAKNLR